jgi:hypothetical protein
VGYFILGFPTETCDELDATVRLVYDLWDIAEEQPGRFRASVFEFRPCPGTPEWQRCGCHGPDGRRLGRKCPKLEQRHHGSWYFRYSEPAGPDGRRRQPIAVPYLTRKAAEEAQVDRLDRTNKGIAGLAPRSLTVAVDFKRWLASKANLKPSTFGS